METALREAHEEVGLPPGAVDMVGALAPVGTFVTNYAIYPFVGLIEPGFEWVAAARPRWRRCSSSRSTTSSPALGASGSCARGIAFRTRRLRGRRPHGLGRDRRGSCRPAGALEPSSRSTAPRAAPSQARGRAGRRRAPRAGSARSATPARAICLALRHVPSYDHAAHRRVDELLPQHPQPPVVQLGHRDRAHQPAHDRDAVQRVHQRRRSGPGRRRRARRRPPRSPPRAPPRVVPRTAWPAARSSRASARPAAAAGDDQDARHSASGSPVAARLLGSSSRWRCTLASISSSSRSGLPRRRRISFCAAIICSTSSISFCGLDLGRAGRLPVEDVERRALGEHPEQQHEDDEEAERAPEDDGERVDAVILAPVSGAPEVIGVLGAGTMGAGIAQLAAQSGRADCCCTTPTPRRSSAGWRRPRADRARRSRRAGCGASDLGSLGAGGPRRARRTPGW